MIINFPDVNIVDPACRFTDGNGQEWKKYAIEYDDDGKPYTFQLWALSPEDAERRLKLPMRVAGQIMNEE